MAQAGTAGTGYPLGVDSAWVSGPYTMVVTHQTDTAGAGPFETVAIGPSVLRRATSDAGSLGDGSQDGAGVRVEDALYQTAAAGIEKAERMVPPWLLLQRILTLVCDTASLRRRGDILHRNTRGTQGAFRGHP